MRSIKRTLLFCLLTVFCSCASGGNLFFGTTNDPVLIDQGTEIEMGKGVDQGLRKQYAVSTDRRLQEYVGRVGQDLVRYSSRKNLKYSFTVLDDKLVNAFAAPGGYVYITTGILKMLHNEAELAGVLGHEIGHVVHRHSLKAIQRQIVASLGLQVVVAVMGAGKNDRALGQIVLMGGQAGLGLLMLKNSRENELESDREGVNIMNRAGYSPQAMVSLQEMFLKLSGGKSQLAILSTHPPSAERIQVIKKHIAAMPEVATGFYEETYNDATRQLR